MAPATARDVWELNKPQSMVHSPLETESSRVLFPIIAFWNFRRAIHTAPHGAHRASVRAYVRRAVVRAIAHGRRGLRCRMRAPSDRLHGTRIRSWAFAEEVRATPEAPPGHWGWGSAGGGGRGQRGWAPCVGGPGRGREGRRRGSSGGASTRKRRAAASNEVGGEWMDMMAQRRDHMCWSTVDNRPIADSHTTETAKTSGWATPFDDRVNQSTAACTQLHLYRSPPLHSIPSISSSSPQLEAPQLKALNSTCSTERVR